MAQTRFDTGAYASSPRNALANFRFAGTAVTLFCAVLTLSFVAPPAATAALGMLALAAGLAGALVLWAVRWPQTERVGAWDVCALSAFLGFVAVLISDATHLM